MSPTDEELEGIAKEVSEAVPALRKFFSLGRKDQVQVGAKIADKMVGTDVTAQIKTIPGLTSGMTETLTDLTIPLGVSLFLKLLLGEEEPSADPASG